jgi:hypothetical protein
VGFIDVNIYQDKVETAISLSKTLNWIIPFLLGLFSVLIIESLKRRHKNRKIKNFTIKILKDQIKPSLPLLKEEYNKVKNHISNVKNETFTVKVFEHLNIDIFEVVDNVDYYSIFKEDFVTFSESKAILAFLITHLPHVLSNAYFLAVDNHLKENGDVGNIEHVRTCAFCKQKRERLSDDIDLRIKEIETLESMIDKLIDKYSA